MTICVIIPVYNAAHWIIETLDSITSQTKAPNQIIIVDDGSTDNSYDLVNKYAEINKKVCEFKVIQSENGGAAKARNIGLEHVYCKFVCFADADDPWVNNKLELQLEKIITKNLVSCITDLELINSNNHKIGRKSNPINDSNQAIYELMSAKVTMITPTIMYRWDAKTAGLRFNEKLTYWEDLLFFCKLSKLGPMGALNRPLVYRRVHPASISQSLRLHKYRVSCELFCKEITKIYSGKYVGEHKSFCYRVLGQRFLYLGQRDIAVRYLWRSLEIQFKFKTFIIFCVSMLNASFLINSKEHK